MTPPVRAAVRRVVATSVSKTRGDDFLLLEGHAIGRLNCEMMIMIQAKLTLEALGQDVTTVFSSAGASVQRVMADDLVGPLPGMQQYMNRGEIAVLEAEAQAVEAALALAKGAKEEELLLTRDIVTQRFQFARNRPLPPGLTPALIEDQREQFLS
jgi:hypothetical protein